MLASGPNPLVNIFDFAGLATLARMVMEDYWIPVVFGENGQPLLKCHRQYEDEIWKIVNDVIPKKEEQEHLRTLIQEWHEMHPEQRFASFVSISEYAQERWRSPIF